MLNFSVLKVISSQLMLSRMMFSSITVGFIIFSRHMKKSLANFRPIATKIPVTKFFGKHQYLDGQYRGENLMDPPKEIVDAYSWLRDDSRKDENVLSHLTTENKFCMDKLESLCGLKNALYDDMLRHLKETDEDVPYQNGNFLYYSRTQQGLSYRIHCRKTAESDPEFVILDENLLAAGFEYSDVSGIEPSPSHKLLAYCVDRSGSETYDLKIKYLNSGDHFSEVISGTNGHVVWGADDSTLYYLTMDAEHRPFKVWRHALGTTQDSDVCLYTESDCRFWMGLSKTRSDAFISFGVESKETSEMFVIDIRGAQGAAGHADVVPVLVRPRVEGMRYDMEHLGEYFYFVTNLNAKNNRLVRAPVTQILTESGAEWTDVRPYNAQEQIDQIVPFANHMAVVGRAEGIPCVWLTSPASDMSTWDKLLFAEEDFTVRCSNNYVFETSVLRLVYASFVTPRQVLDVNMQTLERVVRKEQEVPGYDRSLYVCSRLAVTARDGRRIPVSMVHHRAVPVDANGLPCIRSNPSLLYGYGSYGICIDPSFDYKRLALLDRGLVYVIAHIRGGGEMGRTWYEDEGKYLTKLNTFQDFIDCGQWLVDSGVTSSQQLAIEGRSAGGLLVGAVVNMAPKLFKVAVASVPFVDIMNTMSDPTIPLTVTEWEEWGNPNQEKFFNYMLSYSPYDNVCKQDYPAMLITAGLHDPRVAYWEPAKWVAKLREMKTDNNPLYLKTDLTSGHFSASDRYKFIKETAFEFSFVLDQIGAIERLDKSSAH